jgi:LmbE family N-acetylglucosaminyl deacetylase
VKILLSPHFDDEVLFASYVLLREHPWVVFCLDGAPRHGDVQTRMREAHAAARLLGCDMIALHSTPDTLADDLADYQPSHVWAPLPEEDGNSDHNIVGETARGLWPDRTTFYTTYTEAGRTMAGERVEPLPGWETLKRRAMSCYESQYALPAMRPHFRRGLDEYEVTEVRVG